MSVFVFIYGTENYCVRVGFTGARPLIYAVYRYNSQDCLPAVPGQTYKTITESQYDWLIEHRYCDVSYAIGEFIGRSENLECRTHRICYTIFTDEDPFIVDLWDERQI